MAYTTIHIHGNLISEEILQQIELGQVKGQQPTDFGMANANDLREEIEYAYSRLRLDWKRFSEKAQRLPAKDPYGTSLTREWMRDFLQALGFHPHGQKTALKGDNGQFYAISHTDEERGGLPLHIVGFLDASKPDKNTLDIRSSGGTTRLSPHATLQEYLNVTEHLFGLVSNGYTLRLLRDSGRLVRLSYIEFDLRRLFDEENYSEFALLYRLLHATRFPDAPEQAENCLLESYYQDSIESGNRIRDGLSHAAKKALQLLGQGLMLHPENEELRRKIADGALTAEAFNHELLRFMYRLLFLIVTEERDLIYPEALKNAEQKRIYYRYYSIMRLRKLSAGRHIREENNITQANDLWIGLMQTFRIFETNGNGRAIGIEPPGSDLFSPHAIENIAAALLDNNTLLECIRLLNEFTDKRGNRGAINYRSLDVEELGSIYEGLLELRPVFGERSFDYNKGSERSASGSHYTPEDLVKPLVKYALEPLIDEAVQPFYRKQATAQQATDALLALRICDAACGSGHILLSAARRLALEVARVQTGEQQPNPAAFRAALRSVIRNCIYGVDKNPLAVELCKVALWLESQSPGEPLNFLDHHIRCGDAIAGLAKREQLNQGIPDEAFKTLPTDDKDIAKALRDRNRKERKLYEKEFAEKQLTEKELTDKGYAYRVQREETRRERKKKSNYYTNIQLSIGEQETDDFHEALKRYRQWLAMPETTAQEVAHKEKAWYKLKEDRHIYRLKALADAQLMPFFLPKTRENMKYFITDADFRRMLEGYIGWTGEKTAKATAVADEHKLFHWFIEFPEVFADEQNPGFHCIVGNPPFLGGQKLSGTYGENYLELIKYMHAPIGAVDLVTFFFRRNFELLKKGGFMSLIATNTVAQGRAREDGLEVIVQQGGSIHHAVRSMKWPGVAAVEVALVSLTKQPWKGPFVLGNREVSRITPYLDDAETTGNPLPLPENAGKSFQGSIVLGQGFVLTPEEARALIARNPKNKDVLFPYLNGDDLNNNPDQSPSRWVINFFDWPLSRYTREEWLALSSEQKQAINEKIEKGSLVTLAPCWYGGKVATDYPDCFEIVERLVKPEREKLTGNPTAIDRAKRWWQFARQTMLLYRTIAPLERVLVVAQVSKTVAFEFVSSKQVLDAKLIVFAFDDYATFALLQSTLHNAWAWTYCTTMKADLSYTPSAIFQTYPFPEGLSEEVRQRLEEAGSAYHAHRAAFMLRYGLGSTKTYNLFHAGDKDSKQLA